MLIGNQLGQSEKIKSLIQELSNEVQKINSNLKTVSPATAESADQGKVMMEKIANLRGRPLHYPFIGTGAGRGPFVEVEDGSVKLDLINGIGIHLFGHGHPKVMEAAIQGALSDIVMQGNLEPNREYVQMTEKLVRLASKKSRLKYAWLTTCGAMANENALKMARQKKSPARKILAFKNAFAGRSTMMAEITDNPGFKQGLPEYNEVLRLPFYDRNVPNSSEVTLNALKEHISKNENDISCFVFEPMLGEGGYMPAPREFFIPLLELCRQKGIVIWLDEVQTFTRTGEMFAFEKLGLGEYVDLCTIAKTAQIGATLYTEELNPKPGLISGTFSGSTVSLKAGMVMLDMIENDGYLGEAGRIQKIHHRMVEGLSKLGKDACGMGLMIGFTPFDGKKEQVDSFLKKLYANGVIAFSCGKDPVRARFLVPACITDQEIDLALSIIEKTIKEGV